MTKDLEGVDTETPGVGLRTIIEGYSKRIDDLAAAERVRVNEAIDAERRRINEQLSIRADYNDKLALAESKRIDAIRAVDVQAVSVANDRATAQASVLANQVSQSAETLRALVAATAATVAQQLAQISTQFTDRLSSLEKSQYEKQGSSGGMKDMGGVIISVVTVGIILAGVIFAALHK